MSFLGFRSSLSCRIDFKDLIEEMIQYKQFVFNSFQVNTIIVYSSGGACIIVDPACSDEYERGVLTDYISDNGLKPEMILATHGHFDHLPGVHFVQDKYSIPFCGHRDDLNFLQFARHQGGLYGFSFDFDPPEFNQFLVDNEIIDWGGGSFRVLHVPGHSRGSLAYHFESEGFVITGDVLFRESIGRTDLPGGDLDKLINSIKTKLMVLSGETRVLSGHGPETSIAYEREYNPFL